MSNLKDWERMTYGAANFDAGNSLKNFTHTSRIGRKPQFNADTCINCFFCWVFCPENAIMLDTEKVAGINYDFCKGCGICANECPVKNEPVAIQMVEEPIEL